MTEELKEQFPQNESLSSQPDADGKSGKDL